MNLRERQIWQLRGGGRGVVQYVGTDRAMIVPHPCTDPLQRDSYRGIGVTIGLDGNALDRTYCDFDLATYRGVELDLTQREGIQALGLWVDDCLKMVKTLERKDADAAIDRIRARLRTICEGYPDGLPLEHR